MKLMAKAFSLVEVLAAIAVIGIITFLAIPNIVRVKQDSEESLALSRAASLNMAMASYVQANGATTAQSTWTGKSGDQRYALLTSYLAFAPGSLADFFPSGYSASFPDSVVPLSKVGVVYPTGATNSNY